MPAPEEDTAARDIGNRQLLVDSSWLTMSLYIPLRMRDEKLPYYSAASRGDLYDDADDDVKSGSLLFLASVTIN